MAAARTPVTPDAQQPAAGGRRRGHRTRRTPAVGRPVPRWVAQATPPGACARGQLPPAERGTMEPVAAAAGSSSDDEESFERLQVRATAISSWPWLLPAPAPAPIASVDGVLPVGRAADSDAGADGRAQAELEATFSGLTSSPASSEGGGEPAATADSESAGGEAWRGAEVGGVGLEGAAVQPVWTPPGSPAAADAPRVGQPPRTATRAAGQPRTESGGSPLSASPRAGRLEGGGLASATDRYREQVLGELLSREAALDEREQALEERQAALRAGAREPSCFARRPRRRCEPH